MTKNRIKKQKCSYHENDRDISEYIFAYTDIRKVKHVDIYRCKKCEERHERELDRENRIRNHNRKQEDAAYQRYIKRFNEKEAKINKSIEEDLWDFKVRDYLAKGTKLKGYKKYLYKESIPKEILQLARATIKLNREIDRIKKCLPSKKELLEQERIRQSEIDRANKKPIMKCSKHGDCFYPDVIKSGIDKTNGKQKFRCKQCVKIIRANHYKNNKEKVLEAHKIYKNRDPERYKNIKNSSNRKCWAKNREKYIKKSIEWDNKNKDKKSARQKRSKNKKVAELHDVYIKQNLVAGTKLKHAHISKDMVDITREILKIKRIIKLKQTEKEIINDKNTKHETTERSSFKSN